MQGVTPHEKLTLPIFNFHAGVYPPEFVMGHEKTGGYVPACGEGKRWAHVSSHGGWGPVFGFWGGIPRPIVLWGDTPLNNKKSRGFLD